MLQEIINNGFRWIDATRPNRDQMSELKQKFSFHELNLEDSLSKIQIPKIDRYDDHMFIILLFPTIGQERIPKSSQLAVFIGSDYLVTIHQGDLNPMVEMFEQCSQSEKSKQELMGRSAGYLFHSIIDVLSDNLLDYIRKIVGNIDDIEDLVFDEKALLQGKYLIYEGKLPRLGELQFLSGEQSQSLRRRTSSAFQRRT